MEILKPGGEYILPTQQIVQIIARLYRQQMALSLRSLYFLLFFSLLQGTAILTRLWHLKVWVSVQTRTTHPPLHTPSQARKGTNSHGVILNIGKNTYACCILHPYIYFGYPVGDSENFIYLYIISHKHAHTHTHNELQNRPLIQTKKPKIIQGAQPIYTYCTVVA